MNPYQVALGRHAMRIEVVEALLLGIENHHRVAELTLASVDREEAKRSIREELGMSDMGVEYVLDMTTSRLTKLGRQEYEEELDELRSSFDQLQNQGEDAYNAQWRREMNEEIRSTIVRDVKAKMKRRVKKLATHPNTGEPQIITIDSVHIDGNTLTVELHDENRMDHLYAVRFRIPSDFDAENRGYDLVESTVEKVLTSLVNLLKHDGLMILEPPPALIEIAFDATEEA